MKFKKFFILMTMFCISCSSVGVESFSTNTPSFVTSTLPPITAPVQATQTLSLLPTTPVSTHIPSEGIVTTQINLRAETTTASQSLDVIPAFTNIQIIGKESSGNWYKVIYNESIGWVRAEFVQAESSDKIALVEIESSAGSSGSGVVISGINVRSGAGTQYESIGVLTPKDVVIILGKDSSGAWMQINFQGQVGWVATEFLQIENVEQIPVFAETQDTPLTPVINETPTSIMQIAIADNDSMQAPLAKLFFDDYKIIQVDGQVSFPQGDHEDWVAFSSFVSSQILIESSCVNSGLQVELWRVGQMLENLSICSNDIVFNISANESYTLRIFTQADFVQYLLKIEIVK